MTPHCLWECPANLLGVIPTRKAQGCPALLPRSLWKQGKTCAVTLTGVISHFIQQMDWCGKRLHLSFWASLSFSSSSPAFSRWDLQIAEAELHPIGAGAKSPPHEQMLKAASWSPSHRDPPSTSSCSWREFVLWMKALPHPAWSPGATGRCHCLLLPGTGENTGSAGESQELFTRACQD